MVKRGKRSLRVAAGLVGLLASMALAFFFTTYITESQHEGTTGEGTTKTMNSTVNFENGLTPEHAVPVTVEVENTSGAERHFKKITMHIETPTVPQCGSEWLELWPEVTGTGKENNWWKEKLNGTAPETSEPINVETGTHNIFTQESGTIWLRFKPGLVGSTNQTTCEKTTVKVTAHLEGS